MIKFVSDLRQVDGFLRVELEDFENRTRYAEYQSFTIGNAESKYRLDIDGYSGNAGLFTNRMV